MPFSRRPGTIESVKMASAWRVELVDLVADVEQLLGRRCARRARSR